MAAQAIGGDKHWDPQFEGNGLDGPGLTIAVDNVGDIYVGGLFTTAGATPASNIAKWDGASWQALGSGVDNGVEAIAISTTNDLYVGGAFHNAGGTTANHIALFDGATWQDLGGGANDLVLDVDVDSSDDVYAAGIFTEIGSIATIGIAKWDGQDWSAVGGGVNGSVTTVLVHSSGEVYIGGDFTQAGSTPVDNVARWDGSQWHAVGTFPATGGIFILTEGKDGDLYAGGANVSNTGANVVKWNDDTAQWEDVGGTIDVGADCTSIVTDLAINEAHLYVAVGDVLCFPPAEPDFLLAVAELSETGWQSLGNGIEGTARSLEIQNVDDLYVAGNFLTAGGHPSPYFAHWNEGVILSVNELGTSASPRMSLWPNPSSGELSLRITDHADEVDIVILDLLGRKVDDYRRSVVVNKVLSLDLSHLPVGIYIMVISTHVKSAHVRYYTPLTLVR